MSLVKALAVAREAGLTSLYQLECFVMIAQHPRCGVVDLVMRSADSKQYRQFMGSLRKLMIVGYRDDGLNLVRYGDPIPDQPKGKELVLTRRGQALWRKIEREL